MPQLPAGAVTFLFTDIEGSTRLWDEHPEAMRAALRQHDDLLRACIETHEGRVFKTMGDAFCAVFSDPADGVEAVLASQQWLPALALQDGTYRLPLRVRMALHVGMAEERDGDYFGPPLNRVARVLATAYGGQVLLTLAAAELARDSLPKGAELRSLGEHRLKDLGRPETVFQLCHPGLPADFPPLRSLNNPELKHNLPQQTSSFVGREEEMGRVRGLLEKSRLLTLTGAGGSGKTRLALQVAADQVDAMNDGVWLVELAPLADAALVPQAVATVLGLRDEPGKPPLEALIDHLRGKHLLLLLDNCEHLLDAAARLADQVLRHCPQVRIIATSREGLGVPGEQTYRVPSLSLPDPKRAQTPETLSHYEAVRLFVDRALLARPHFQVTNANAPALASICVRLDGIPLALELAAARTRALSLEEIHSKLDQRFRLLTGGSRTALPRQQTLRSLIDWSYDLLNEPEKMLLQRASVFAGGWTLGVAEAVCAGGEIEAWEVLDLLTSLVDKSLAVVHEQGGLTRYRLLETVRQYARDRLLEDGAGDAWRDRHATCFVALGEEAERQLTGPDQQLWLERLEAEHDNLRVALEWACKPDDGSEEGERLAGALWRFWLVRGHYVEGADWLSRALRPSGPATPARAKVLTGSGVMASNLGDSSAARPYFEAALAIRRELGDTRGVGASLMNLGTLASDEGDYAAALALYSEGLLFWREVGDQWGIAATLNNLSNVTHAQGDLPPSRAYLEESLAIKREMGDRGGLADSLGNLGNVAHSSGDHSAARKLHEEALAIRRELGDRRGLGDSLTSLGAVALSEGDPPAARALLAEAQSIRRDLGDRIRLAHSLELMATLATYEGAPERAARLWGAAERLREEIGAPMPTQALQEYENNVDTARKSAGAGFDAAWAEGRSLTLDQALDQALDHSFGALTATAL